MPSADQIARIIIAAARAMDADPVDVATIYSPRGLAKERYFRIARSRYYAACALRDVFRCNEVACARLLGISSPDTWMGSVRTNGAHAWFDDAIFAKVREAAEAAWEPPPARAAVEPEELPAFLPAPRRPTEPVKFITLADRRPPETKGDLRRMLAEAVVNTAKMTPKE